LLLTGGVLERLQHLEPGCAQRLADYADVVKGVHKRADSMMDGVHIIERIHARGAMIKVLDKPHLDLTTPIGRGFIAFLSALAEDERQRIVKRANDGLAAARKRGVHMGRKSKLTDLQRRVARERVAKGESARSIAREWGVAHTTVARAVG
jgi:DNA invertase Pin-like site-specific DNA recombinase